MRGTGRRSPYLRRRRPFARPRATALATAVEGAQLHRFGRARRHVREGQLQCDLQVLAAVAVPPGALAAAEEGVEPAHGAEVAHEDAERVGQIEVAEAESAPPPPPPPRPPPPGDSTRA